MTMQDERQAFSKRFKEAVRRAQLPGKGATYLAREFNLRYQGDPVTPHAVRKWLLGAAIPSQDKIRTLARWLDVSAPWLRLGEPDRRDERAGHHAVKQEGAAYRAESGWPARKYELLSDAHKALVTEVIHALLRLEGKQ